MSYSMWHFVCIFIEHSSAQQQDTRGKADVADTLDVPGGIRYKYTI